VSLSIGSFRSSIAARQPTKAGCTATSTIYHLSSSLQDKSARTIRGGNMETRRRFGSRTSAHAHAQVHQCWRKHTARAGAWGQAVW